MREFVDAHVQNTSSGIDKTSEEDETSSPSQEGVEGTDEEYDMVDDVEPSSYIPTMKGDFTVQ